MLYRFLRKRISEFKLKEAKSSPRHGARTVSYTHLDVYKRQVDGDSVDSDKIQFERALVNSQISNILKQAGVDTVSYTHLDVYKRQDRNRLIIQPNIFKRLSWTRECVPTGAYTTRMMETRMCIYL